MSAKPFPLAHFDTLTDKQPIACVTGTLSKLFTRKTGTSSVGDWSIQNGELLQDGVAIPVQFKDCPEVSPSWRNRDVIIEAHVGKSLTGLYCLDDDKNGVITRKIKVTPTAIISLLENGGHQPAQQQPATGQQSVHQHEQPAQQQATTQTTQQAPPKEAPDSVKEAKKTMIQIMNLHLLSACIVEKMEAPAFKKRTGHEMSESVRQGATASIFIESCRTGLVRNMPTSLIPDIE